MDLKCPVVGCENKVDLRYEDGVLYWIDPIIPEHHGRVEDLQSPLKEQFLGVAYEKGIIKHEERHLVYTTQNKEMDVKKEMPYDLAALFILGVALVIISLIFPISEYISPYILYVIASTYFLYVVIEYFALNR